MSLVALAGYVDALAYIELGGFFVSFMSGNSTHFGVGILSDGGYARLAAGLILGFVFGAALGSIVRHTAPRHGSAAVLICVSVLLLIGAVADVLAIHWLPAVVMVMAMGAENAVFERDGELRLGLTYMTGNLVKVGQGLAGALLGRAKWAWLPQLMLWSAFVAGVIGGTLSYNAFGLQGLWGVALAAALLSLPTRRIVPA